MCRLDPVNRTTGISLVDVTVNRAANRWHYRSPTDIHLAFYLPFPFTLTFFLINGRVSFSRTLLFYTMYVLFLFYVFTFP